MKAYPFPFLLDLLLLTFYGLSVIAFGFITISLHPYLYLLMFTSFPLLFSVMPYEMTILMIQALYPLMFF